jgi:hypothetical protein
MLQDGTMHVTFMVQPVFNQSSVVIKNPTHKVGFFYGTILIWQEI